MNIAVLTEDSSADNAALKKTESRQVSDQALSNLSRHKANQSFIVALAAAAGLISMATQIGDNSTFVHLRTGIDILDRGRIPTHDVYSAFMQSKEWTVQSWFPSLLYGISYKIDNGGRALVFLHALLSLITCVLMLKSTRGNLWLRLSAFILSWGLLTAILSPRPLMFAALCMAALVFVVVQHKSSLWLLPIYWLWTNSHGSWPIGLVWTALVLSSGFVILRRVSLRRLRQVGLASLAGIAAGAIGPLGVEAWTFPLKAFTQQESLKEVREWMAPRWDSGSMIVALVALILMVLMLGSSRKVRFDYLIGFIALAALGLKMQRNLLFVPMAFAPIIDSVRLAELIEKYVTNFTTQVARVGAAACVLTCLFGAAFIYTFESGYRFDSYPVDEVRKLDESGQLDDGYMFAPDIVGCYMILIYGRDSKVVIDDRYDMYPVDYALQVSNVVNLRTNPQQFFDERKINSVVIQADTPLDVYLSSKDQDWSKQPKLSRDGIDSDWSVYVRPDRAI